MGADNTVRRLVAAMEAAGHCGPASFRPIRDGEGTRAYLVVVVAEAAS